MAGASFFRARAEFYRGNAAAAAVAGDAWGMDKALLLAGTFERLAAEVQAREMVKPAIAAWPLRRYGVMRAYIATLR